MAVYNGRRWLPAQLSSIRTQLAAGDEIVVVDVGSTDGTPDDLRALGDPRLRLLSNPRNLGVRASFERALRACRGEFIFLSDQDDVWLPGKVQTLTAALADGALLALSDASVIDADGREVERSFMARRGGFRGSLAATLVRNRYLGCTMALRRELLDLALPIPERVPMHDMWIGALATMHGRVAYIDRALMQYRRHGGNVSPDRRAGWGQMLRWRIALASLLMTRRIRGPRPITPEPAS